MFQARPIPGISIEAGVKNREVEQRELLNQKSFQQSLHKQSAAPSAPRKMSSFPLVREELLKDKNLSTAPSKFSYTMKDYFKNAMPTKSTGQTNGQRQAPRKSEINPIGKQITPPETIEQAIKQAALKHNVPEKMIRSVIQAESNFNPKAVSPVGAQGLMQLMPGTAKEMGVKDSFDVKQNIDGGAKYLRQMLDTFGDQRKAIAAYNAGPGAVKKFGGVPPYRETQNYVRKVMNSIKG